MLILLAAESLENKQIAEQLGMTRPAVSKWRNRFFYERVAGLEDLPRGGRPDAPPELVLEVKSLAFQLPAEVGVPLSRFSQRELQRHLVERDLVATIFHRTIWRWLSEDALRPGIAAAGCFPGTPSSLPRPGACWTCTRASGRESPWGKGVRAVGR